MNDDKCTCICVIHFTHLIGLLQHVDQVVRLGRVLVREQRVGGAGVVRATGATDAVHIVLRIVRVVVIDYKLHIFHIWVGRDVSIGWGGEGVMVFGWICGWMGCNGKQN